ncbi:MAG: hypothetical protein U9Q73_00465 [Nanoarchaeota archaeon]|nr:hypothetical protein [Nanoarchaeota archaeon]
MASKCKKGYKYKKGKCRPTNKIKCVYKNIKKEGKKKRIFPIAIISLVILALIFLPTGIDDAFTTLPLLALLGWKIYLTITLIIIVFLIIFFKHVKKIFKGC